MKKYKKSVKKIKNNRVVVKKPSINVEKKGEVELVRSNFEKKSEDEIRELQIQISDECNKFKEMYYSTNIIIDITRRRSFCDLVKKYLSRFNEDILEKSSIDSRHY
ncbi:MAG: hypothetical protein VZR24_07450 [Butyrivibrio hungatei]|nr:hypothetical protein [Butyrivibrio hungatei]